MKFVVSWDSLHKADDGRTTRYRGYVDVNGELLPAYGSDRGTELHDIVLNHIEKSLDRPLMKSEYIKFADEFSVGEAFEFTPDF